MTFEMLQNWRGRVEVDGVSYDSVAALASLDLSSSGTICIKLYPEPRKVESTVARNGLPDEVRITVKRYMTQKASPDFDFMAKWNEDNPMPFRTMVGVKVKETRGMVYMKLHGDIWAQKICTCMKCGKPLTNPVSQYFGIGPECGGHNYVNPFETEEQLKEAVAMYKKELQKVTWEGWVIKSAILEEVPV